MCSDWTSCSLFCPCVLVIYGDHTTTGSTIASDYTADRLQLTPCQKAILFIIGVSWFTRCIIARHLVTWTYDRLNKCRKDDKKWNTFYIIIIDCTTPRTVSLSLSSKWHVSEITWNEAWGNVMCFQTSSSDTVLRCTSYINQFQVWAKRSHRLCLGLHFIVVDMTRGQIHSNCYFWCESNSEVLHAYASTYQWWIQKAGGASHKFHGQFQRFFPT
jgi:hypothetical protein